MTGEAAENVRWDGWTARPIASIGISLFDRAPVAYSILSLDGEQIDANRRFWELFGYQPDTRNLNALVLTHPDDRDLTTGYLDDLVSGRVRRIRCEKRYLRADGSVFWGELVGERVTTDVGRTVLLGVINDVTRRHQLEEELRKLADERLTFVGQVNHELRNPLHTIAGLAELLSSSDLDPLRREQAETIFQEARETIRLVGDLVELSRPDRSPLSVVSEPFAIRAVVDRVIRNASRMLESRDGAVTLEISIADDVHRRLMGDPHRLAQILDNLVGNAIKFTTCGTVRLDITMDDAALLSFRVLDTGPGIPVDRVSDIFEPFSRVHHSVPGTGLGLAIAGRLARAMGGSLEVESTGPDGSTFVLRLALDPVADADRSESARPGEIAGQTPRHRVLVVEDSTESQLVVAGQLERLGYDFEIVGDGLSALEALQHSTFSVALVDWHLPGMDGLEVIRRLRALESEQGWNRTPVVSVTARSMPSDIEACLSAGADEHLVKPAGLAALSSVLRHWTDDDDPRDVATPRTPRDRSERPIIDRATLDRLLVEVGDAMVLRSVIHTYLDQLPSRLAALDAAWGKDADVVATVAHSLKGTSATIGASSLSELATAMESEARHNRIGSPDMPADLRQVADRTAAALRDYLAENGVTA